MLAIALSCTLPCSCSKESGPTAESVPATADYLLEINLTKLTEDVKEADDMALPDTWAEMARLAAKAESTADFGKVLIYKVADASYPFAAVNLTDRQGFVDAIADAGWTRRKSYGAEMYQPADGNAMSPCLVIDGDGAWCLATPADAKALQASLKEAADGENFTKFMPQEPVDDQVMAGALNPASFGLAGGKEMVRITGRMSTSTGTLRVDAEPFDPATGKPVAITGMSPIDLAEAESLSNGPGSKLSIAVNVPKGIDWSGLIELCGPGLGTRNQGMLQSLLPYFASLDGMLVISIDPLDEQSLTASDIEQQPLAISATLEGARSVDAVEEINGNLRDKGVTPRPRADGVYAFTLNDVSYRYTARNGRFLFAMNREIGSADSTKAAATTDGKAWLSAALTLPQLGGTTAPAMHLDIDNAGAHLELTSGPGTNPLAALGNYFNGIEARAKKARREAYDYYDDYD